MNKKEWFILALIVAANALAIALSWNALPDPLPAHYDLDGNASGTMCKTALLLYPLASAAFCLVSYAISLKIRRLSRALVYLASGASMVVFSSSMVSLTSGTMPIFMLAEPVILLGAVAAFIICAVRSCKKRVSVKSKSRI